MRLALFGLDERISARRAYEICLVSEVVPRADLWDRAHTLARRLADKAPLAVQGTVKAVWDSFHMSAAGAREIPLHYPQLGNPLSKQEFGPGERPTFETR
jgi:enoyl-CoA hydratase/carnithine racemase